MRTSGLLLLGLLLLFTTHTYLEGADLDPTARDQNSDLAQAIRLREHGELTDGSRSPLLPALLAPFARRAPDFFVDARLVAVGLAALTLLGFYLAVRRAISPRLALLAALVLLVELRFQVRRICPEPLLALLLVLATAVLAHLPASPRPRRLALGAGALLGVAWLAKGSALLSLVAALAWLLGSERRRGLAPAALLLLGFLLAGAPLLGWNLAHGRWPLANASSDHVMWEDAWDQDLDRTSDATLTSYLESHSLADVAARLGHGLRHQKAVEWPLGFFALLLGAAVLRRLAPAAWELAPPAPPASARRAWRTLALLTCVVWLPPMAWYEPVVVSRRFLFPVVPILLPAALDIVCGLVPGRLRGAGGAGRLAQLVARAAAPLAVGAALVAGALVVRHGSPWDERHVDDASLALVQELSGPRYRDAVILAKPSRTLPPDWLLEGQVAFLALPASVPQAQEPSWIASRAQHVLLSRGLSLGRPRTWTSYAGHGSSVGSGVLALPAWLRPEWGGTGVGAQHYVLLRVVPESVPR